MVRQNKRDECATDLVLCTVMRRNKWDKWVIYLFLKDLMKRNRRECLDVVEHDKISGDLTKSFGRHNFARDDFLATWQRKPHRIELKQQYPYKIAPFNWLPVETYQVYPKRFHYTDYLNFECIFSCLRLVVWLLVMFDNIVTLCRLLCPESRHMCKQHIEWVVWC